MEKCRICGLITSGSEYDTYKNEVGKVLPEIAFTVCDYCYHHEIDNVRRVKPKGKEEKDESTQISKVFPNT